MSALKILSKRLKATLCDWHVTLGTTLQLRGRGWTSKCSDRTLLTFVGAGFGVESRRLLTFARR
jgi:hypothetical protein